jgi:hypothetical protein
MSQLVDDEGNIYEQGFLGGWQQKQGLFGPEKDVGWFGQPNIERDIFGNPVPESSLLGGQVYSDDGRPLYRPSTSSGSGSSSGGDAAAAMLGLLMLAGGVLLAGVVLAALFKILAALFSAWHNFTKRYPRTMRVIHLTAGMIVVGLGLSLAGFDRAVQLGSAALVPLLWTWLWLTRRLPLVFLPVNALVIGGILWLIGEWMRPLWLPVWPSLIAGFPSITENLSLVLAALPLMLLLLAAGSRRWPTGFAPFIYLMIGGVVWFVFMRIWTSWQPVWATAIAPVPFILPVGWLILLAPLVLWLWFKGQQRWPTLFMGFNLLVFGGLLALSAYHLQPTWINTWRVWTMGLPIGGVPFIVIGVGPFSFWSWNRVSHRWPRAFVVPNLLLSGGILWLILDRTRPFWTSQLHQVLGNSLIGFDIALVAIALPLAAWLWQKGSHRWPKAWALLYTLILGVVMWWVAERTRGAWESSWQRFFIANPALVPLTIGLTMPLLWLRAQLRKRWPRAVIAATVIGVSAGLFWLTGQLLPTTTDAPRALVAALPIVIAGWGMLLHFQPRLGWTLTFLFVAASGLAIWLVPSLVNEWILAALRWLVEQGVPIDLKPNIRF